MCVRRVLRCGDELMLLKRARVRCGDVMLMRAHGRLSSKGSHVTTTTVSVCGIHI